MKNIRLLPVLLIVALLSGCATHTDETKQMREHWAGGRNNEAHAEISETVKDKTGTGDELVWKLELGAVARSCGNFDVSNKAFSSAHALIEKFENESDVKLTQEAKALLTNQSYIPYKGYNYDKIMLSVYQSLNCMETKEFEDAAVQLKKLENYQRNAELINKKRIEREEAALEKAKADDANANYDASQTLNNPAVSSKLAEVYGEDYKANTSAMQAKAIYVNPFAYWISGIFFMNKAEDASDKNRASDFFRLAGEMLENKNSVIVSDLKTAEDYANGKIAVLPNRTYVIYETGLAPVRKQFRIDLPLYVIKGNIPHVAVNFPYLHNENSFAPDITVQAGSVTARTEIAADMDAVIKKEFNNELPAIITKTIVSSAMKAGAQYAAARAAGDGWGSLAVNISGSIYQAMMNDADLRTWTTLPKQIKIAKVGTPINGIVSVDGQAVKVNPRGTNIIWAKRTGAGSALLIRTFDFADKKTPKPATPANAEPAPVPATTVVAK